MIAPMNFANTKYWPNRYLPDVAGQIIMNPDALPDELRGWRRYRIEYGGHAERCVLETPIYLPPWVRVERLERLLNS